MSADGNCDCGDIVAFDPKGFCKKHQLKTKEKEPDEYLPDVYATLFKQSNSMICIVSRRDLSMDFMQLHCLKDS